MGGGGGICQGCSLYMITWHSSPRHSTCWSTPSNMGESATSEFNMQQKGRKCLACTDLNTSIAYAAIVV